MSEKKSEVRERVYVSESQIFNLHEEYVQEKGAARPEYFARETFDDLMRDIADRSVEGRLAKLERRIAGLEKNGV